MKLLFSQFFYLPGTSCLLTLNTLFSILCSNTSLCIQM